MKYLIFAILIAQAHCLPKWWIVQTIVTQKTVYPRAVIGDTLMHMIRGASDSSDVYETYTMVHGGILLYVDSTRDSLWGKLPASTQVEKPVATLEFNVMTSYSYPGLFYRFDISRDWADPNATVVVQEASVGPKGSADDKLKAEGSLYGTYDSYEAALVDFIWYRKFVPNESVSVRERAPVSSPLTLTNFKRNYDLLGRKKFEKGAL